MRRLSSVGEAQLRRSPTCDRLRRRRRVSQLHAADDAQGTRVLAPWPPASERGSAAALAHDAKASSAPCGDPGWRSQPHRADIAVLVHRRARRQNAGAALMRAAARARGAGKTLLVLDTADAGPPLCPPGLAAVADRATPCCAGGECATTYFYRSLIDQVLTFALARSTKPHRVAVERAGWSSPRSRCAACQPRYPASGRMLRGQRLDVVHVSAAIAAGARSVEIRRLRRSAARAVFTSGLVGFISARSSAPKGRASPRSTMWTSARRAARQLLMVTAVAPPSAAAQASCAGSTRAPACPAAHL